MIHFPVSTAIHVAYLSNQLTLILGIINQITILRAAPAQTPSPFKANKPYRAPVLSPTQVHAQEQRAVNLFTKPISIPGPSSDSESLTTPQAPTSIIAGKTILDPSIYNLNLSTFR